MGEPVQHVRFDAEYLRRLKEGDPDTESHFSQYFSTVLRLKLMKGVRSLQMLQDVRQETLLRVLLAVRSDGITQPASLGAYVCATSNYVLWEYRRTEQHYNGPSEDVPEPLDERMAVERDLITEERKRIVRAVLDELSLKERNVLRLLFLEEKNKAEVCRKMRISPDYLRVLLHRAKTSFRQKLACAPEKTGCA
jgi:RNA polymerase sigma-70 factor (ECF subfamily)